MSVLSVFIHSINIAMKKISFSFVLFIGILQTMNAQNPFSVANTSTNFVTSTSGAQQMTQDNATGNIGIGIDPTYTDCALAVTNANYGSPPTIIMGVGNMVNGLTLGPGMSAASFACIRVDNSTTPVTTAHTPLAIDFMVDAYGLVGIGAPASYGSDGFAHLFLTDPNPSGTVPLMRVITNAATDAFFIGSNGNVGIGSISPVNKLDVAGTASAYSLSLVNASNYAGWTSQIKFLNSSNQIRHLIFDDNSGTSSATNGNLVIIPGYYNTANSTGANNTLSILGKLQVGNVPVSSTTASTLATDYSLYVEKGVIAEKYKCALKTTSDWSDYVFDKGYKLKPLSEVEMYIGANKHLPGVPSAEEVQCDGIDMAQMDATLLKKIEELTLYVIELKQEIVELKSHK